ncbi:MAG TPA: hypothetical protein VM327_08365 [Candidatus Thermoplasmatota archaeon]|nr:hypothetical protein [Candidatus Thermoplasmatota archaeon]
MRSWLPLVLPALLLAACLDSPGESNEATPDGPFPRPPVSAERIPHDGFDYAGEWDWSHGGDPTGHALASNHAHSHGIDLVGYNPLTRIQEGSDPLGHDASFIALDSWTDGAGHYYVCVAHFQAGPGGGATIVDVTDPTEPVMLATVLSGMQNSDCMFTDDGRFLLVAAYSGYTPGLPLPPPAGDLAAQGVLVYDVSDKANPRFLHHDTVGVDGNAYHNVFTARIGDTNYVFQTYTGNILALDEETGRLTLLSTLPVADHDIWVGHHPLTGNWIAITGAGPAMAIYDVEDPRAPKPLAEWTPSEEKYTGWHRQWPLENDVDGHAIMLVAGEEGASAADPTWYTALDFTDPTDIVELGHWSIPVPEGAATQHEFESWNGYVATANYHSGVWVLDIGSLARAQSPVTIGYYLPHEDPVANGGVAPPAGPSTPNVWGTVFDDRGFIYAADRTSGLYVLRIAATPPLT